MNLQNLGNVRVLSPVSFSSSGIVFETILSVVVTNAGKIILESSNSFLCLRFAVKILSVLVDLIVGIDVIDLVVVVTNAG